MPFLYDGCNVKLQLYVKALALSMGFLFHICCMAETMFSTHIMYPALCQCKSQFVDYSRTEETTFSHGKIIIFFETFIWSFLGQSCIETVRGPLIRFYTKLTLAHFDIHFVCNYSILRDVIHKQNTA